MEFTYPRKILYPELRVTKEHVIEHYVRIAPIMLELLTKRPLVVTRYPDGVEKEGARRASQDDMLKFEAK